MIFRTLKYGAAGVASIGLLGALVFGTDLGSYVWCSARSVQTAVKDSVPIEFELQRARDMVESIIPELQSNIRLIAQEEVEIAALKKDIQSTTVRLAGQKERIAQLRYELDTEQVSLVVNGRKCSREHVARQLARHFDGYREGQVILASKRHLLDRREDSLEAANRALERARGRKAELEQQIEALAAKHRLLKAASVGTQVQIDGSRLTKAEKLITEITKRLDVAERVLEHESDFFFDTTSVDAVSESELIHEVDEYFNSSDADEDAEIADSAASEGA